MTAFWMNTISVILFIVFNCCCFLIHQGCLCLDIFKINTLFNLQHRLLMNGKIKALILFLSPLLSLAICHHVFFPPSCCLIAFLSNFFFTFISPSVSSATPNRLPLEIRTPLFMHSILHEPSSPLPTHPSILPIFQYFHPPISLSTLMRSRMTMNTPIIMRKQQAFPPPLHSPLPNLGPPINR